MENSTATKERTSTEMLNSITAGLLDTTPLIKDENVPELPFTLNKLVLVLIIIFTSTLIFSLIIIASIISRCKKQKKKERLKSYYSTVSRIGPGVWYRGGISHPSAAPLTQTASKYAMATASSTPSTNMDLFPLYSDSSHSSTQYHNRLEPIHENKSHHVNAAYVGENTLTSFDCMTLDKLDLDKSEIEENNDLHTKEDGSVTVSCQIHEEVLLQYSTPKAAGDTTSNSSDDLDMRGSRGSYTLPPTPPKTSNNPEFPRHETGTSYNYPSIDTRVSYNSPSSDTKPRVSYNSPSSEAGVSNNNNSPEFSATAQSGSNGDEIEMVQMRDKSRRDITNGIDVKKLKRVSMRDSRIREGIAELIANHIECTMTPHLPDLAEEEEETIANVRLSNISAGRIICSKRTAL